MNKYLFVLFLMFCPLLIIGQDTSLVRTGVLNDKEFFLMSLENLQKSSKELTKEVELTLPVNFNINGLSDSAANLELRKLTYAQQLLAIEKGLVKRNDFLYNNTPVIKADIKCNKCADSTLIRMRNEQKTYTEILNAESINNNANGELKVFYKENQLKLKILKPFILNRELVYNVKEYNKENNQVRVIASGIFESDQKEFKKVITYSPVDLNRILIISVMSDNQNIINKAISINNILSNNEN